MIGTILDQRYKIDSLIGQGHSSLVYKADHMLMGRTVAIKIMNVDLASDPKSLKRFQREAQAVSSLTHPNIVSIFDFGITAENTPYLVMDYLDGESLAALLEKEQALPQARAAGIFQQVCSALSYAHGKGIVHRDIKPSNFMIVKSEASVDTVKIIDFGIAKLIAPDQAQNLTSTGELFVSPIYMSPEQCLGRDLDARSDIYSLGCVMYETLTGTKPFAGETPSDTVTKHVSQPAPAFDTLQTSSTISLRLETVVQKSIKKNPADRYQSMSELATALEPFAPSAADSRESAMLKGANGLSNLVRLIVSQPAVIAIAALAGLGIFAAASPDARLLIEDFELQLQETVTPAGSEQLMNQVSELAEAYGKRGNHQKAATLYTSMLPFAEKHWVPIKLADLYGNICKENVLLGQLDLARTYCDKASLIYNDQAAYTKDPLFMRDQLAKELLLAEQAYGPESRQAANCKRLLSPCLWNLHSFEQARSYAEDARRIEEKPDFKYHEDLTWTYSMLGALYSDDQKFDKAEKYYKLAAKTREEQFDPIANDQFTSEAYRQLGQFYMQEGKLKEAEATFELVAKFNFTATNQVKDDVVKVRKSLSDNLKSLAVEYAKKGNTAKAAAMLKESMRIAAGPDV